jgi:hypothetical protein
MARSGHVSYASHVSLVDPYKPNGRWTWLQIDGHRWTLQLKPQLPAIALNMANLRNADCLAVFTACPFHSTNRLPLNPAFTSYCTLPRKLHPMAPTAHPLHLATWTTWAIWTSRLSKVTEASGDISKDVHILSHVLVCQYVLSLET